MSLQALVIGCDRRKRFEASRKPIKVASQHTLRHNTGTPNRSENSTTFESRVYWRRENRAVIGNKERRTSI